MAVVGVAEVLVRPSFKSFQSEVGKAVDQATPESGPASPGSRMGKRIATGLKVAGGAAITGAGVVLGTALTKGFGRLTAIENAQAKLTGLGHDAGTVEGIMRNATAAVKGTAFGLGDAATASAAAVAAGVQPGEELEGVLKLMGDAATIAGTDFTSMATIFNKVKASGKLQGDEILQLSEAGIPILQLLAQELGVTASEVSDMASEGEIDFETFRSAMEAGMGGAALKSGETLQGAFANSMAAIGRFGANLMSGVYPQVKGFFASFIEWMGPVEAMGKTIGEWLATALGGFVNFLTGTAVPGLRSFGETVAAYVGPAFSDFAAFLTGTVLPAASNLATFVSGLLTPVFAALADYITGTVLPAVGGLLNWFRESPQWVGLLTTGLAAAIAAVAGIGVALKGWAVATTILTGAKALLTGVLGKLWAVMAANPVTIVLGVLAGLAAAAVYAYQNFEQFRVIVDAAWAGIVSAAQAAWTGFLQPTFQSIGDWLTNVLAPAFTSFWQNGVVPAWNGIVAAVQGAWTGVILPVLSGMVQWVGTFLAPLFVQLWQGHVAPAFLGIASAVQSAWAVIGPALAELARVVGPVLAGAFNFLAPIVARVAQVLGTVLGGAVTLAVKFIFMLVGAFVDHLGGAIQGAIRFLQGLVQFISGVFTGNWAAAWEGLKSIVVGAFKFIWHTINVVLTVQVLGVVRGALSGLLGLFRGGLSSVTGVFSAAWNGIVSLMRGAWSNITGIARSGASGLTSIVNGLVNAVLGFFRSLGSGMGSIVRNAWSVARSTFGGATAALRTMVSQMVQGILGFFRSMRAGITSLSKSTMTNAKNAFIKGIAALEQSVSTGLLRVQAFFRDLPGRIMNALGNLGGLLKDSGRALLAGFTDGITNGFSRAKDAVADGLGAIRRLFPFSPAKEGPFSGRGYTTYSGRALSRDFADAIADEAGYLRKQAAGFMDAADFSASSRITAGVDLVPLSTRDLLLDGAGRLPAALQVAHSVAGPPRSSLERLKLAAPEGRQPLTLVLEDGTAFPAYLDRRTDTRLAGHVAGLAQPLRQYAGAMQ